MENLNVFIPIKKVDVAQRLVYGTLAAEVPDHANEIMDYETSAPNWKVWSDEIHKVTEGKSAGNVRAMHTNIAAGKLIDISFDDDNKIITGCAKIVDDNEWNKVLEGVYTGFSMGGKYEKRWTDPSNPALKRYTATVHEVSIVDLPCIPTAKFEVIKADGSSEMRKFKAVKEADADLKQVWLAEDGSTHDQRSDAVRKNLDLALAAVVPTVADAMDALKKAQDALAAKGDEPVVEPETTDATKTVQTEPAKTEDGKISTEADAKAAAFKAAVTKAVLSKQLCDIPQLIDVISNLQWLQSGLEWDTLFDDAQTSTLPADLKAILSSLCDFLKAMVEDATADITADKAAGFTPDHIDALRKFSANPELLKDWKPADQREDDPADLANIAKQQAEVFAKNEALSDELTKAKAEVTLEKAAKAELEKAVGTLKAGIDDLVKGIGALNSDKEEMAKRLARLEAQPMPAKAIATTTVPNPRHETQESGSAESVEAITRKYRHLPPEQARKLIQSEIKALSV